MNLAELPAIDTSPRGIRTHLPLLMIVMVATGLRIGLALTHPPEPIWPDGNRYNKIAAHVLSEGEYPAHESRSAPLHPLMLALVYGVFGFHGMTARVVTSIFGATTCLVLYGLGKRLFSREAGLVAAMVLAIYPLHVYLSGIYEYPQTLFILLLSTAIYQVVSLSQTRDAVLRSVLPGITIGLASMAVPTIITAIPIIAVWLLLATRHSWHIRILRAVLVCVGCSSVVLGWSVYIHASTGKFQIGSGAGAENLFKGNCALAWEMGKADIADRYDIEGAPAEHQEAYDEYRATMQQAKAYPAGRERNAVYKEAVYRFFREHPSEAGLLLLRKAFLFWCPYAKTVTRHDHNNSKTQVVQAMTFVPVLLAAVLCVLWRGRVASLIPIYTVVVTQWLTYSLLLVNIRYRLHTDIFLIVLAAPVLLALYKKMTGMRIAHQNVAGCTGTGSV